MFPHKHYSCPYYVAAPGNISGSLKEIESQTKRHNYKKVQLHSTTSFLIHGPHQIPFGTGMEELALFQ